jgi:hypothetical protein
MTIIHGDDKVHAPWLTNQVAAVVDLARAARSGGRSSTGRDSSVDRRAGGPQLVLSGRASLVGRIEADVLGPSGARLVHKQGRQGARVVRYRFPS